MSSCFGSRILLLLVMRLLLNLVAEQHGGFSSSDRIPHKDSSGSTSTHTTRQTAAAAANYDKHISISCIAKVSEESNRHYCVNGVNELVNCFDEDNEAENSAAPVRRPSFSSSPQSDATQQRSTLRTRKLSAHDNLNNPTKDKDKESCVWRSLEVLMPSSSNANTTANASNAVHSTTMHRLHAFVHNAHYGNRTSKLSHFELLRHAFDLADRQADVRRLYVVYSRHDHHRVQGMLEEEFLHHMTWWRVVRESYLQYRVTAPSIAGNQTSWKQPQASSEHLMEVLLEKVPNSFKPWLQFISSVYYPARSICRNSTMLIHTATYVHPGFTAEFSFSSGVISSCPFCIFAEYDSVANEKADSMEFITGSDCPNNINKFECAFYPTTNCTVPFQISKCKGEACVHHFARMHVNSMVAYPADYDGVVYSENDSYIAGNKTLECSATPKTELQREYWKLAQKSRSKTKYRISFENEQRYINATTHRLNRNEPTAEEYNAGGKEHPYLLLAPVKNSVRTGALIQFYLFRYNHFYRNMIHATLLNFTRTFQVNFFAAYDLQLYPHSHEKNKHHKESKEAAATTATGAATGGGESISSSIYEEVSGYVRKSCVAAHIRRGDRTVPNVNMTKYCEEDPNDTDKGCYSVPLGSVTLKSVLRNAERLVNSSEVHSLVVATDDFAWFEEEKKALEEEQKNGKVAAGLQARWNVYGLQPLAKEVTLTETITMIEYRGGTANGLLFHASLELMQQCEAFLGHFESSVSDFIYQLMCSRHRHYRNICPPVYDMRWGL